MELSDFAVGKTGKCGERVSILTDDGVEEADLPYVGGEGLLCPRCLPIKEGVTSGMEGNPWAGGLREPETNTV